MNEYFATVNTKLKCVGFENVIVGSLIVYKRSKQIEETKNLHTIRVDYNCFPLSSKCLWATPLWCRMGNGQTEVYGFYGIVATEIQNTFFVIQSTNSTKLYFTWKNTIPGVIVCTIGRLIEVFYHSMVDWLQVSTIHWLIWFIDCWLIIEHRLFAGAEVLGIWGSRRWCICSKAFPAVPPGRYLRCMVFLPLTRNFRKMGKFLMSGRKTMHWRQRSNGGNDAARKAFKQM